MYGWGRMGYVGRGRRVGPFGGSATPALVLGLVVGGLFLFSLADSFGFFPILFLLWWMVPFVLVPMAVASARGVGGLFEARRSVDGEHGERELLEALARHGEITAARAALETTLSVAEADRMLSELAKNGHIEVRAREGRLGYALWEHDQRELTG
jgi:hypothetical protein